MTAVAEDQAPAEDRWSRWLLETRFGGDAAAAERGLRFLREVRDRVLDAAKVVPGETLLDVGCGDGLIAFGALDRVGDRGHVVFSDISRPLLDRCRALASDAGALARCSFVEIAADDLRGIDDASVDIVTTRSVLIYVKDKAAAFREFRRVLRPGGRLSIFEPINSFSESSRRGAVDAPVGDGAEFARLAQKLREFYRALQPDDDPMLDFDERDLLRLAEDAGFRQVRLRFEATASPAPPASWEGVVRSPGNPNIPALAEAMDRIFTAEERARYERHVRPKVERGGEPQHSAAAYLLARTDGQPEAPATEEAR